MEQLDHVQGMRALELGHYFLLGLSMVCNLALAYLAYKAGEAKQDRELKFRMLQYQIESSRQNVVDEVKSLPVVKLDGP
jgi:hypothetical protein